MVLFQLSWCFRKIQLYPVTCIFEYIWILDGKKWLNLMLKWWKMELASCFSSTTLPTIPHSDVGNCILCMHSVTKYICWLHPKKDMYCVEYVSIICIKAVFSRPSTFRFQGWWQYLQPEISRYKRIIVDQRWTS